MSMRALFEGLVSDTNERPVGVANVGGAANYVVEDGGFKFHIEAESVDRQVLAQLREQILANRDAVTEGTLKMLGQEDLFTKAMVDSSLNNMDANFAKLIEQGLPEGARQYLGMLGFRVVIDYHGDLIRFDQPGIASDEDE